MPLTITYTSGTPATANDTDEAIDIVAVPNGNYHHNNRAIKKLEFDLNTTASGVINVTPPTGMGMPAQTCLTSYKGTLSGPYTSHWLMTSSSAGKMTLTIPAATGDVYHARLEIEGGNILDIVLHR